MLPAELIADFWRTVERELQERHSISRACARDGIKAYRSIVEMRQIGDLTYHHNPEHVAETIARGVAWGHFQPLKNGRSTNGIHHEDRFLDYIQRKGVSCNKRTTASPRSYVSYLRGVSKLLSAEISPDLLHSEESIKTIIAKLQGKRQPTTIPHYVAAMRHYVEMVREQSLWSGL